MREIGPKCGSFPPQMGECWQLWLCLYFVEMYQCVCGAIYHEAALYSSFNLALCNYYNVDILTENGH